MIDMEAPPLRLYREDDSPLYMQAADAVYARIQDGSLRPGDRLPSVRRFADELGINPATVVAAYRILARDGVLESRRGSGAYVATGLDPEQLKLLNPSSPLAGHLPSTSGEGRETSEGHGIVHDLAINAPPKDLFPLDDIKRFLAMAVDIDAGQAFEYQVPAGYGPLRHVLAEMHALMLGSVVTADSIHIVSGAQQGLDLVARVILRRGDLAIVETPGYRGAADAFLARAARVEAVAVGPHGIDLDQVERLARSRPLRLVYVNPSFQNPSAAVYSAANRQELARLAEQHGFYIIEDDLMGDLAFDGLVPAPVRAYDTSGHVLYLKSFSKSLMPGLRIACLEAPATWTGRLESAKRTIDLSANGLMQRVLYLAIATGRYQEHLRAARLRYQNALQQFCNVLDTVRQHGLTWEYPAGGLNLWLGLPPGLDSRQAASRCLKAGCLVAPEAEFRLETALSSALDRHLRISYASVALDQCADAASRIARALCPANPSEPLGRLDRQSSGLEPDNCTSSGTQ
jgi:DNA-binding transcriptional MocR family regulator